MCLLVISKGTNLALKNTIFSLFFCRQNEMFFCHGGKLVVNSDVMTTDQKHCTTTANPGPMRRHYDNSFIYISIRQGFFSLKGAAC